MAKVNFWKKDNREQQLADLYQHKSLEQLAEHFNTSVRAVRIKMSLLGLRKGHRVDVSWLQEVENYIRLHHKEKTPAEMAERLRMNAGQVEAKLKSMGLAAQEPEPQPLPRPPARYSNPDYSHIDRYYQQPRNSYYAQ